MKIRFLWLLCLLYGLLYNSQALTAERQSSQLQVPSVPMVDGNKVNLNLRTMQVTTSPDYLLVNTGILLDNKPSLAAMLLDGANLNLKLEVVVEMVRLISNDILFNDDLVYNFRYDLLRREFAIDFAGNKLYFKTFELLVNQTLEQLNLKIPINQKLETQETYRVTIKPSMLHAEVPPWLKKALFFWSWEIIYPYPYSYEFVYE